MKQKLKIDYPFVALLGMVALMVLTFNIPLVMSFDSAPKENINTTVSAPQETQKSQAADVTSKPVRRSFDIAPEPVRQKQLPERRELSLFKVTTS